MAMATAGVVGVLCSSSRIEHRDSGPQRRGRFVAAFKNPPEIPPCPRGNAVFIEHGAATRHAKLLFNQRAVTLLPQGSHWNETRVRRNVSFAFPRIAISAARGAILSRSKYLHS